MQLSYDLTQLIFLLLSPEITQLNSLRLMAELIRMFNVRLSLRARGLLVRQYSHRIYHVEYTDFMGASYCCLLNVDDIPISLENADCSIIELGGGEVCLRIRSGDWIMRVVMGFGILA